MSNVSDGLFVKNSANVEGIRCVDGEGVQPYTVRYSAQVSKTSLFACSDQRQHEVGGHWAKDNVKGVAEDLGEGATRPQAFEQLSRPAHREYTHRFSCMARSCSAYIHMAQEVWQVRRFR